MKLIVGLGNPGFSYRRSRHNIGFMAIDHICEENGGIRLKKKDSLFLYSKALLYDRASVIIAKPLSYMNMSGFAVKSLALYYKIRPSDIIVLFDDFAIPFAKIRIRRTGSDGGHNGLKSIIQHLGSRDFIRIRIGIGQEDRNKYGSNYVLSGFSKEERRQLGTLMERVSAALSCIVLESVEAAMNNFN